MERVKLWEEIGITEEQWKEVENDSKKGCMTTTPWEMHGITRDQYIMARTFVLENDPEQRNVLDQVMGI